MITRNLAAPLTALVLLLVLLLVWAPAAAAGGGPETTLVVVNQSSPTSVRIANEYVRLRDIPPNHVLYLEHVPAGNVIHVEQLRMFILRQIDSYLEEQGLTDDIETIAYSTDFPYGINFDDDVKVADWKPPRPISRTAALTGLTYLHRHVTAKDARSYLTLQNNNYYRRPAGLPSKPRELTGAEKRLLADAQGAMQSKDWRRAAEALAKVAATNPEQPGIWYNLACCRALLGEKDAALDALEQAAEHGFRNARHAAEDPDLQDLREHERFARILEAMAEVQALQPTRAFTARHAWTGGVDADPDAPADSHDRYRMAVMLGWTGPHGNTQEEVLACLRSAAASDGTAPDGTVYFMVNGNIRAKTREPGFEPTVQLLRRRGRKAEILRQGKDGQDGILPRGKDDVIGLMAGTAGFKWPDDLPPLLPGAIAEHLTSFGAHFGTASQTKCTEFIRHGAAGTSGTVAEPYAIQQKFPFPAIHLHYARGCSLAEAFYQSVWGPYQLLILGDPLARPFAHFATVSLDGPDPETPWQGTVEVEASVSALHGGATRSIELWVDGRKLAEGDPGTKLALDTTRLADGRHELRLVAVDAGPIRTRSYTRREIVVRNGIQTLDVKPPAEAFEYGGECQVEGKATSVDTVELLRGAQVLATAPVEAGRWSLAVRCARLGLGPVVLSVRGRNEQGAEILVTRVPVEIQPPSGNLVPQVVSDAELLPGLVATIENETGDVLEGLVGTLGGGPGRTLGLDLQALDVGKPVKATFEGYLRASASGLWEINLRARAKVRVVLDDVELFALDEAPAVRSQTTLLGLEEGWHALRIETEGPGIANLALHLGGAGPSGPAAGALLAHRPHERVPASDPEQVVLGEAEKHQPGLVDGKPGGKGVDVPPEGVVLAWKRTERNVAGVVLFADRGKNAPPLPASWIVEIRKSTRGRWRAVKDVTFRVCPPTEKPRKDRTPIDRMVEIAFRKTSARQLRVRPAEGESRLTEIRPLVWRRPKR